MKTPAVTEETSHKERESSRVYMSRKVNGIISSNSSLDMVDDFGNETCQASVENTTDNCVTSELQYNANLHSLENGTENIPPSEECGEMGVSSQSLTPKVENDDSLVNSFGERGRRGQLRRSKLLSTHRRGSRHRKDSNKNQAKHVNEA